MAAPVVSPAELAALDLELTADGRPRMPLVFVDLRDATTPVAPPRTTAVVIGLGRGADPQAVDCALVEGPAEHRAEVSVPDLAVACARIETAVAASPRAAATLTGLLRCTASLPVDAGLVAESLAYSMLLAGAEFRTWRRGTARREIPPTAEPPVLLSRDGGTLRVMLNRPGRHNAFDRGMRDGLADAFDLAGHDDTITAVEVRGAGSSFCSGGDLDEFGASTDVTTAHLVRLERSVAGRLERCRDRVHVTVQGACIGAGIEIPSFAQRVTARPDAFFQLPELAMGLVPGAGGTVGITRRIGRWRTAYFALTGDRLDRDTAVAWGLVDD